MKIVVLAGGISPERDVSLTSGSLIANALIENGHSVALVDLFIGAEGAEFVTSPIPEYRVSEDVPNLDGLVKKYGRTDPIGPGVIEICKQSDVVFLALHGGIGEDGKLQATLDNYGIKYTGSGYVGSLLAMDKEVSKRIFTAYGIITPEWISCNSKTASKSEFLENIGLPCVVKPCSCGSSVGVTMVRTEDELDRAFEFAAEYDDIILAEKMIIGRELTVAILDGQTLPAVEIIPKAGFYDYKNKYQSGMTEEICPAQITAGEYARLAESSKAAFEALRLKGYARFDFIMDKDGIPWLLEANTLPGMTPISLLPQMAKAVGLSYAQLCEKIVRMAL